MWPHSILFVRVSFYKYWFCVSHSNVVLLHIPYISRISWKVHGLLFNMVQSITFRQYQMVTFPCVSEFFFFLDQIKFMMLAFLDFFFYPIIENLDFWWNFHACLYKYTLSTMQTLNRDPPDSKCTCLCRLSLATQLSIV